MNDASETLALRVLLQIAITEISRHNSSKQYLTSGEVVDILTEALEDNPWDALAKIQKFVRIE